MSRSSEAASGGKTIFTGFGIGFLYQAAMGAFKTWKSDPEKVFGAPFKAGSISATIEPALLGVGYIIGPRIASIMCAGGVLAYLVLIPAIKFFGEKVDRHRAARHHADQRDGPERYPRRLRLLYRRGRGRGGRHYQSVPLASHDLARTPGRAARSTAEATEPARPRRGRTRIFP